MTGHVHFWEKIQFKLLRHFSKNIKFMSFKYCTAATIISYISFAVLQFIAPSRARTAAPSLDTDESRIGWADHKLPHQIRAIGLDPSDFRSQTR